MEPVVCRVCQGTKFDLRERMLPGRSVSVDTAADGGGAKILGGGDNEIVYEWACQRCEAKVEAAEDIAALYAAVEAAKK